MVRTLFVLLTLALLHAGPALAAGHGAGGPGPRMQRLDFGPGADHQMHQSMPQTRQMNQERLQAPERMPADVTAGRTADGPADHQPPVSSGKLPEQASDVARAALDHAGQGQETAQAVHAVNGGRGTPGGPAEAPDETAPAETPEGQ